MDLLTLLLLFSGLLPISANPILLLFSSGCFLVKLCYSKAQSFVNSFALISQFMVVWVLPLFL
jgi:hypothetical protein